MLEIRRTSNCGIREISGIMPYETPENVLFDAIPRLTGALDGAFAFFSVSSGMDDNHEDEGLDDEDLNYDIGEQLRTLITAQNLGTVVTSGPQRNG